MFAYCGNEPILREDQDGKLWNIIIGAAVGAFVGGLSAAIASYQSTGEINWGSVGIGAAAGGISGAISATGMPALGQAIASGIIATGSNIATQTIVEGKKINEINIKDAILDGVISFGASYLGSAVTKKASDAAKHLINKGIDRVTSGLERYNTGSRFY